MYQLLFCLTFSQTNKKERECMWVVCLCVHVCVCVCLCVCAHVCVLDREGSSVFASRAIIEL